MKNSIASTSTPEKKYETKLNEYVNEYSDEYYDNKIKECSDNPYEKEFFHMLKVNKIYERDWRVD